MKKDFTSTLLYTSEITTIAKGASITFFGIIVYSVLIYIFELVVARNLGPSLFGIYFLGLTIFKVLERVTTVGFDNGVLRYVSLYRGINDKRKIKGTIILGIKVVLIAGSIFAFLLIFFSGYISQEIFNENKLSIVLKFFSIVILFTALFEIIVNSSQAFLVMKYKVFTKMIFEPGLRVFLVVIFLFFFRWALLGVVFSYIISIVVVIPIAFYYLKKIFPEILDKKIKPDYNTKEILSYSWPLFFVGFLDLIIIQINTLMLGYFRGSQSVGIYGVAQRTAFVIPIVLTSFNAIFAPMISDLYNRNEKEKLENLFKIVTKWIFTISFPLFLIMLIFSKEILQIWGGEYIVGWTVLIIIGCAQIINCSVGSVGYIISMIGRTKVNMINSFITLFIVIILNIFLIPKYGVLGAAFSIAIALAFINIIRLIEVYSIMRIHPYRIDFFKPIISGLTSGVIIFLIKLFWLKIENYFLLLGIGVLAFVLLYVVILYFLKLNDEDKFVLEKIKSKLIIKRCQ